MLLASRLVSSVDVCELVSGDTVRRLEQAVSLRRCSCMQLHSSGHCGRHSVACCACGCPVWVPLLESMHSVQCTAQTLTPRAAHSWSTLAPSIMTPPLCALTVTGERGPAWKLVPSLWVPAGAISAAAADCAAVLSNAQDATAAWLLSTCRLDDDASDLFGAGQKKGLLYYMPPEVRRALSMLWAERVVVGMSWYGVPSWRGRVASNATTRVLQPHHCL